MKQEFTYRLDRRTGRLTAALSVLIVLAVVFFVTYSRSGYFPIWFTFFALTILLLYILSIPRKIRVTDEAVEILCVVELTRIALEDIVRVRKMEKGEMKFSCPLLASYGFFGYYGWYYNLSEFSLFKVYVGRWKNFVRIDDIYETTYVVSCDDPDALVAAVEQARADRLKETAQVHPAPRRGRPKKSVAEKPVSEKPASSSPTRRPGRSHKPKAEPSTKEKE